MSAFDTTEIVSSLKNSRAMHERASRVLVGGVNSPVRSFRRVGGHPILATKGEGAFIVDVDGRRYVDLVMSYGPHFFGHAFGPIVRAQQAALENSSAFGMTSEGEIQWAELLLKRFPHFSKVRMMSTGTEACATAIRLARAKAKRDVIVKFAGHYHGHVDSLLVDSGSGVATLSHQAVADSAGLPQALIELSRVLPFNDLGACEKLFLKEGHQIAGVIIEPVMGNMGVVPPDPEFLKGLRALCTQHGAALILDEVMTGLRVDRNSAQGRYGVVPDLCCLGKIVGGGSALSALVGKTEWMDLLAPLGPVYQAGTLSGNPVGVAAGLAMLAAIDENSPYDRLEILGAKLETVLMDLGEKRGIPIRVERVGSMISVFFRKERVRNAQDARAVDEARFNKFFWLCVQEGIMLPPSPFEAYFLSTAHELVFESHLVPALRRVFEKL